MASGSKLAVVAALVANLIIALLKLGAAIVSRSASMFAEAAHSFGDTGNQVLLLVGLSRAARPPSAKHPYGSGKSGYFWSFLVAVLLFGVAGAYSAIEGIDKLLHPHPLGDIRLALGVLALSFVIEIVSFVIALRQARREADARGIKTVRAFVEENRDAVLLTVLVEDGLALAGLPIAAGAIGLAAWTGDARWDGVGSLVIGLMLMGFALFLAWEVQGLLVGRGLTRRDLTKVHTILAAEPHITRVHSVESMYLGSDAVLLGIEVDVDDGLGGVEVKNVLAEVEVRLIAAVPHLKYVYLQPGRRHDGAS